MKLEYVNIPTTFLLDENLSLQEAVLLGYIHSTHQQTGNVIASNKFFGSLLKVSKDRASKLVSSLRAKGYVSVVVFMDDYGYTRRKITPIQPQTDTLF